MKKVQVTEITGSLTEYIEDLGEEPVILMTKRKPLAVLLPVKDADLETVSLSMNPNFIELIQRSRERHAREGGTSSDELRRQLGLTKNGSLDEPLPGSSGESSMAEDPRTISDQPSRS